jgi:uncharacterized repeat protein (TIGR03803 family)
MRGGKLSIGLKATLERITIAIFTLAIFTSTVLVTEASAGTLKVLHNFNGTDGTWPAGGVFDRFGNLYGVAIKGGSRDVGLVFELTPAASGHWNEKTLIEFTGPNGEYPNPVVFDSAGSLYGTVELIQPYGTGAVFKMSRAKDGQWGQKISYIMDNSQGLYPEASVTFDTSGNIFSTAWGGGAYGKGTIFELSPTTPGHWHEKTVRSVNGANGDIVQCNVVFDAAGNLYGTTYQGGADNDGTVWELMPQTDGAWKENILHSFRGSSDGGLPPGGGVIFDAAGNLYGTTSTGGASGQGTVFELSPNGDGTWTETVLHSFRGGHDGSDPSFSALTFDEAGNLYGETSTGGAGPCGESGCGVVFELSPTGGRSWRESVLYRFNGADGQTPWQGLVFDAAGNIYGTTQIGGAYGYGVVFELKP